MGRRRQGQEGNQGAVPPHPAGRSTHPTPVWPPPPAPAQPEGGLQRLKPTRSEPPACSPARSHERCRPCVPATWTPPAAPTPASFPGPGDPDPGTQLHAGAPPPLSCHPHPWTWGELDRTFLLSVPSSRTLSSGYTPTCHPQGGREVGVPALPGLGPDGFVQKPLLCFVLSGTLAPVVGQGLSGALKGVHGPGGYRSAPALPGQHPPTRPGPPPEAMSRGLPHPAGPLLSQGLCWQEFLVSGVSGGLLCPVLGGPRAPAA